MRARYLVPAVLLVLLPLAAPPAAAGDRAAPEAAKTALERFGEEFEGNSAAKRAALERLGAVRHPRVAARILSVAVEGEDLVLRAAAFELLGKQKAEAKRVGPRVARFVQEEIQRKSRYPTELRLDGNDDVDVASPEGRRCLAAQIERDGLRAAAVRCLVDLRYRSGVNVRRLGELMTSGDDRLVLAVLAFYETFECWGALPEIRSLFWMYPEERKWRLPDLNPRGVYAKNVYNQRYGDPRLRTGRPAVVEAIRETVKAITGVRCETVEDLDALLARRDVRNRVKRGR